MTGLPRTSLLDILIRAGISLRARSQGKWQLPRITPQIRHAQVKLLEIFNASKWGSPELISRRSRNKQNDGKKWAIAPEDLPRNYDLELPALSQTRLS
jgi:hypothetical protein